MYAGKLLVDDGIVLDEFCMEYYAGTYRIDADYFWHEIQNNMEYWFEEDMDEIKENYERTLEQLDFLDEGELKEFERLYKEGLEIAKTRQKMEKKAEKVGLKHHNDYLIDGKKLKYSGWVHDSYNFYDEQRQYVHFKKLPKGIVPVEEEVTK